MPTSLWSRLAGADRGWLAAGTIAATVVFFLSINLFTGLTLTSARLDLTADGRYTVSEATREVLARIDEPIRLRFYRSREIDTIGGSFARHTRRVEELLDTYERLAGGKLKVETYDPRPYSPEEDLAMADGVQGAPIGQDGSHLYLGLAGSNSTDDRQTLAYLAPERGDFLEYDLTRMVHDLANPRKPAIALIGDLPLQGGPQTGWKPWIVMDSIRHFFDVRTIADGADRIDPEIGVLLLAQPESLKEETLYAIDQFVMRGGRVLAFVDPLAETSQRRGPMGQPMPGGDAVAAVDKLLASWGVAIDGKAVVGDAARAITVQAYERGRQVIVNYLPWTTYGADNLARDDVLTGQLEKLAFNSAGWITARDGATTKIEPLVRSSSEAMPVEAEPLKIMPDPVGLARKFQATGERYTIAARVTGPVKSAFPDGPPESIKSEELRAAHKAEATAPLNLVLVADADMLADQTWVRRQQMLGQEFVVQTANNGDFAVNALDNLSGSGELIALRGRGIADRPFTLIAELERAATTQYRASEQSLLAKIDEVEKKLQSRQKEGKDGVALTAAGQREIDGYRREILDLRAQLRDVQYALNQQVDGLKRRITALNIWGMPVVIAVVALGVFLWRRRRSARLAA